MKFSVQVETESHLFEDFPLEVKDKTPHLQWDIKVEVEQQKNFMPTSIPEQTVKLPKKTSTAAPMTASMMRKMSSTTELIERMGKGRKVRIMTSMKQLLRSNFCWL